MSADASASPTALVEIIFHRLNDRDAGAVTGFAADRVVEHWPIIGRLEGPAAVRDYFAAIFAAMPDFHIEVERVAAEGDAVFVHWHLHGTFTGAPFYGVAATGRSIDLRGTDYFTIRDGKVMSNFVAYDGMSFAVQAGLLPARGSRMDRALTTMTNARTWVRRNLRR